MRCPKCDSENPPTGKFCYACSAPLVVPSPRESQPVVSPAPGAPGEPAARAIGGDVGMVKGDVVSNVSYFGTTPESSRATKSGEFCGVCGRLLKDDYHRCPQCGKFVCPDCYLRQARRCQDCVKPEEPAYALPSVQPNSSSPRVPVSEAPRRGPASDLDLLLEAEARRDEERKKAEEYFRKLQELEDKRPVTTPALAEERARVWETYLRDFSSTGCEVERAEEYVKRYRSWTPAPLKGSIETVVLGGGMKLELVWIPSGSFQMGSDEFDNEKPIHTVELDGFWMGKYEVTQEQYEAVMGKNPSHFKGAKNPVECVSWNDAVDFCRKASQKTGKEIRLPTEAEWEYACRAGSATRFCFGDSDGGLGDYAWYDGNSGNQTHPVGEKKANDWGLCDMHGNVWEWCGDWYADRYSAGTAKNPQGPSTGEYRVLRGGGWDHDPQGCRSAYRYRLNPTYTYDYYGFRVVCVSRTRS